MIGYILSSLVADSLGRRPRRSGPDALQRYIEARCAAQIEREFLQEEMAAAETKAAYYQSMLSA